MSDLVNALNTQSRSSGVLDSIAHPNVVNPLAAMAGAAQTANTIYQVRQNQANQAIGSILQQSTDENGNVDYEKAGQLAAQAGPVVQMGMQSYLQNASVLRSQQLAQGVTRNAAANNAIVGALSGDNAGLHDRVVSGLQGLVANGVMTQDQATRSALRLPSDPAQLRTRLQQIQTELSPPDLQQEQTAGQRVSISTPQGTYVTTVPPTRQGGTTTVLHGPAPGETSQVSVPMDEQGVIPQDANGVPARAPKSWQTITVPRTSIPGVPQGGSPTYTPPGTPASGTVPSPGRINPVPPSNSPLRNPPAIVTAPASSSTETPAVPGSGGPLARTGPPQGQPEQLQADLDARNKDVAVVPQQQAQLQNMKHAYDALAFITTGKGQQLPNSVFNALAGYGLLPEGAVNRTEKYEEYKKYATQAIIQQGLLQGTDLGRQLAQSANPSDLLMTEANRELLRNNMGAAIQGIATAAAEKDQTSPSAASGYLSRRSNTVSNTDPRGFVWSLYSPQEQQKMLADAAAADKRNGNTNASDRLHRAIGMSSSIPALALPFQQ